MTRESIHCYRCRPKNENKTKTQQKELRALDVWAAKWCVCWFVFVFNKTQKTVARVRRLRSDMMCVSIRCCRCRPSVFLCRWMGANRGRPCELFICVTWLNYMRDITHSMCEMTHSYVLYNSFICVIEAFDIASQVRSHEAWGMSVSLCRWMGASRRRPCEIWISALLRHETLCHVLELMSHEACLSRFLHGWAWGHVCLSMQMDGWVTWKGEVGSWGRVPLERCGAGVEYHFQEFNEPYAPS